MNEQPGRPGVRAPLIMGFLLAGGLLLALGLFADRLRRAPARQLPDLTLVSPAADDSVTSPVTVVFRTSEPLELGSMGWATGDLHPHVLLDGRELMAGPSDISTTTQGYAWTLPLLAPGEHTLLLAWAGMQHRTVSDTTGRTIRFHVR